MPTIYADFVVNGQVITSAAGTIVADLRNVLRARFEFRGGLWDGITKTAVFTNDSIPEVYNVLLDADNTCLVPWEVIKAPYFHVSLFGGDLITANKARVPVEESGYIEGEAPPIPTPDAYAQLVALVQSERTAAEAAADESEINANQTGVDRLTVEALAGQVVSDAGQVAADKVVVEAGVQIVQSAADAETGRVNAENLRAAAESGRTDAEVTRVQAEDLRDSAEIMRGESEVLRKSAESFRGAAEIIREQNEIARQAHITNLNNPHSVTKAQVGLGNVDNTSDANKPVSTAQATALALKADKAQEAWITPTLLNGWVIFTASNPVGYFKDSMGFVHFKGAVKSGTLQTNIFVLPTGYRPSNYSMLFASFSNGSIGSITVKTDGTVQLYSGNNAYVYLDNVIFRAEV